MTTDQLLEELAAELYTATVRPVRFGWDQLPPPVQASWRAGARAAVAWIARRSTGETDQEPPLAELAERLG